MSLELGAIVGLSAGAVMLLPGCGQSATATATATAQIRGNFAQLLVAFRQHDARMVCELLFPFREHRPAGALATDLKQLSTAGGRAGYQRYVDRCAPSIARDPSNFSAYERVFSRFSLGAITIRGSIATIDVRAAGQQAFQARFVHAAGEWRLLEGVQ